MLQLFLRVHDNSCVLCNGRGRWPNPAVIMYVPVLYCILIILCCAVSCIDKYHRCRTVDCSAGSRALVGAGSFLSADINTGGATVLAQPRFSVTGHNM